MVNQKGVFDALEVTDTATFKEIIGNMFSTPGNIRSLLCEEVDQRVVRVGNDGMKATEIGEYGSAFVTDMGKEPYGREVTLTLHRYGINLGITKRAQALSTSHGRVLGSQGKQAEKAVMKMKLNEESRILYDVLSDSTLVSTWTDLTGGTSHDHCIAADTKLKISIDEMLEMRHLIEEHNGDAEVFICGSRVYRELLLEIIGLGYNTIEAQAILTGTDAKLNPFGMKVMYSKLMPTNYAIMAGSSPYMSKPCAFYDAVPVDVVTPDPSGGLLRAEIDHDFAVKPVLYEGLVLFYIGDTTWATPATTDFKFL